MAPATGNKTVFVPRLSKRPPFSVEAPEYQPVEGETIPRRHPAVVNKLKSRPDDSVATLYDLLKYSTKKYGKADAIGWRSLIKTHHETKKVKKIVDGQEREVNKDWTYFEMSGYKFISYLDFERIAHQVGAGLRKLGLAQGDRVHIFAASR
jgi:long-chain acyl-CoA synthetase